MIDGLRVLGDLYSAEEHPPYRLEASKQKHPYSKRPTRRHAIGANNDKHDKDADPAEMNKWASKHCTVPLLEHELLDKHRQRLGVVIGWFCGPLSTLDRGVTGIEPDATPMDRSKKQIKKIVDLWFGTVFGPKGIANANQLIQELQRTTDLRWKRISDRKVLEQLVENPDSSTPEIVQELHFGMLREKELQGGQSRAIHGMFQVRAAIQVCDAWVTLCQQLEDLTDGPVVARERQKLEQDKLKSWITKQKQAECPDWTTPTTIRLWHMALRDVLWKLLFPETIFDFKRWKRFVGRGQAAYVLFSKFRSIDTKDCFGVLALMPASVLVG